MHSQRSTSLATPLRDRLRPGARVVFLGALAAPSILLLAACRSSLRPAGEAREIDPGAYALYERGVEERRRGELDAALDSFRRAIALEDGFVEAHREYQNGLIEKCRPGDLLVEYRALAERHPADPAFRYLLGRLLASPDAQRREFKSAVELDDGFAWGHYGLGFHDESEGRLDSALERYDRAIALAPSLSLFATRRAETLRRLHRLDDAEAGFARAIDLDPGAAEPRAGLILVLQLLGRLDDAIAACERAIAALEDPTPLLATYRDLLREGGSPTALRRAVEVLTRAQSERPGSEPLVRHLGFLRRDLGEDDLSVRLLETALERGGDPTIIVPALRPLHVKAGRYARADELSNLSIPARVRDDPANIVRERLRSVTDWARAASSAPLDGDVLLALARAYEDSGLLEEAGFAYARAQLLVPERENEIEPARRAAETARLAIARVRDRFRDLYRSYLETGEGPDIETVIADVGAILDESTGDVAASGTELARVRTFPFLGAVTEMEAGPGAPRIPAFFARYNHYLLIGRRAGGPVEAYLTRMAAWVPERTATVWGREIRHELVVGDGVELPSYREYLGDGIGGFALDRTAVVNLSAVSSWARAAVRGYRRWAPAPEELFSDAIPAARSAGERLSLDYPLCVDAKLEFLALRDLSGGGAPSAGPAEDLEAFFDAIERHEVAHLFDAQRFLPILARPFRALSLLVDSGFSAHAVEATLEGNAELAALVHAESPRLVLSQLAGFTGESGESSPHAAGYAVVVAEMVAIVAAEADRFPEIEKTLPILPQLFRLGDEKLRDLGRRVAAARGLVAD